jgi:hypothetical protein
MYCSRCGAVISNSAGECRFCGVRLSSQPFDYVTNASAAQILVGGWLLCFCILVTVAAPVAMFAGGFPGRMTFIRVIFGMVTGILVWSVRRTAMHWLRSYFVIALITRVAVMFAETDSSARNTLWFGSLVANALGLLFVFAWIVYFCTSRRVKLTLGANLLEFS